MQRPKYKNVSPWDTSKTRGVGNPVTIIIYVRIENCKAVIT